MFQWPISIYYEDVDAGGVVYHANYLKYFERARTEWLRSFGVKQHNLMAEDIVFVVSHADLRFLKPAKFEQKLLVKSEINQLKKVSMLFKQELIDEKGNCYCQGLITVACVKLSCMRPQAIPQIIVQEFKRAR